MTVTIVSWLVGGWVGRVVDWDFTLFPLFALRTLKTCSVSCFVGSAIGCEQSESE